MQPGASSGDLTDMWCLADAADAKFCFLFAMTSQTVFITWESSKRTDLNVSPLTPQAVCVCVCVCVCDAEWCGLKPAERTSSWSTRFDRSTENVVCHWWQKRFITRSLFRLLLKTEERTMFRPKVQTDVLLLLLWVTLKWTESPSHESSSLCLRLRSGSV